jgi:hypothetical protein
MRAEVSRRDGPETGTNFGGTVLESLSVLRRLALYATFVFAASALVVALPRPAQAFGDVGAFDPRVLLVGGVTGAARASAPARWSWELVQRTSAPGRLKPTQVRADDAAVVDAPFLYLSADHALTAFSAQDIAGLRKFFALGGVLLVDDAGVADDGVPSAFGRTAREQIARVLPDTSPIALGADHVLFKTFYLLRRAEGRVAGQKTLDAIVRGGQAQVVFSSHDIGGALARGVTGAWENPVVPGGDVQRERAIRLAVNIAMYTLCSNYKDDQVHAPFLMRRRALPVSP